MCWVHLPMVCMLAMLPAWVLHPSGPIASCQTVSCAVAVIETEGEFT